MMVSDQKKLANAVGGKTARACDKCIKKRARWYCTADDAFLCQSCDSSVHSANHLARRHERVRLKIASIKPSKGRGNLEISVPSWHRGITKKARTPRQGSKNAKLSSKFPEISSVPEFCSDENSHEENDEQLLYRVPIFDPFVGEFCTTSANSNEVVTISNDVAHGVDESTAMIQYLPSELELAEFAADVESLLGKGLDDESFDMEGLGLLYDHSSKEKKLKENSSSCGKIKVEDEGEEMEVVTIIGNNNNNNNNQNQVDIGEINLARETFVLNFDYDSPMMPCEEEEIKVQINQRDENEDCKLVMNNTNKKILLNLDYESVISAWDDKKSPWTNGERPELDSSDSWPDCMGVCGTVHPYGEGSMMMYGHNSIFNRGREARVLRYREKRRTRLFSKKIRYEVRKLNAEKRPRMKGRFVKRTNFSGNAFPLQK